MNKEMLILGDTEISERKYNYDKNQVLIDDSHIDKILISKKFLLIKKVL